ncbi:hypothetical protein, partial [Sporolactobacillus putidus]|uniref:hypothetical protein n=1 Tax=Sporolactobacillus putidus TaxID=492735 RepID=UPI001E5E400A
LKGKAFPFQLFFESIYTRLFKHSPKELYIRNYSSITPSEFKDSYKFLRNSIMTDGGHVSSPLLPKNSPLNAKK